MMSTILTLMITAMIFQGVMAVIDSVLDMVGANSLIKGIPVIGGHMQLVWAYLFVMISDGAIDVHYGANMEVLQMGDFGVEYCTWKYDKVMLCRKESVCFTYGILPPL